MSGTLYLVATPIGNLSDFSPRAVETMSRADFIAAEDTRVSVKLLNHFGLKKQLVSYHAHNHKTASGQILRRLLEGESCVLVTDAGMPAISDPGEELVALCAAHGITVCPIPGCCALVSALAVSGLPTGRFTFEGFLSVNRRARREHLDSLADEHRTMIFYEAPHKLLTTLADLSDTFGTQRRIALCRELTKLHEQVLRMTLGEALEHFRATPPKGEFVLVVEGAQETAAPSFSVADAVERAECLCRAEGLRIKDAVRRVSEETGLSKNDLYRAVLKHRGETGGREDER